jgi:hypothetical protein
MKVWRGFTLVFWTVILALSLTVVLFHYSLQGSVLNSQAVKQSLASHGVYDALLGTVVTDKIMGTVTERYPSNKLVDAAMVRSSLTEALPSAELKSRLEPVIDVVYQWLDSKRPDIAFEIPVAGFENQFYRALEVRLGNKIATLPPCGDYRYPPEDALLHDLCLPAYITAPDATQAVMGSIRSSDFPLGTNITTETFAASGAQFKPLKPVPTYLNYLWALNYVMIGIATLVTLFLLITRRSHGVLAIGVATIASGILLWLIQNLVKTRYNVQANDVLALLNNAVVPLFKTLASRYVLIAITVGAILVVLASLWLWHRRKLYA